MRAACLPKPPGLPWGPVWGVRAWMTLVLFVSRFAPHGSPPWWGVSLAEHGRRTRRCRQLRLVGRGYVEVGIDIPVRFRRGGPAGDQPACFVVHRPVLDCCRRGGRACGSRARLWRGPGGRGGRACLLLRGAAEALLLWRQVGAPPKGGGAAWRSLQRRRLPARRGVSSCGAVQHQRSQSRSRSHPARRGAAEAPRAFAESWPVLCSQPTAYYV